jgi:hypothetical protein
MNFVKLSIYFIDFNSNEKELNYSITTKELIYSHCHKKLLFMSLNPYCSNVYFLYCQLILLRENKDIVCYNTRFFKILNIIRLILSIIAWHKFHVTSGLFILTYYTYLHRNEKKLWNMPGDSQLKSLGHKLMARHSIHFINPIFISIYESNDRQN